MSKGSYGGPKIGTRADRIARRNQEAQEQNVKVSEYGACEAARLCVGPACNKWDRVAKQCAVRSAGEAATVWKYLNGPRIEVLLAQIEDSEKEVTNAGIETDT